MFMTFEGAQFPGQNYEKGLFSFETIVLGVNDLSVLETDYSFARSATNVHAASAAPDANELNNVMEACICDFTAEASGFQHLIAFYLADCDISGNASPTTGLLDRKPTATCREKKYPQGCWSYPRRIICRFRSALRIHRSVGPALHGRRARSFQRTPST